MRESKARRYQAVVFKNDKKKTDDQPDYNILLSEEGE